MDVRATRTGWSVSWSVLVVYLAHVIVAAVAGAVRLHRSSEMPGLGAIELVLLTLPWSLALGIEPFSHEGLGVLAGLVLGGVVLNSLILWKLASYAQQSLSRGTGGAA